MQKCAALGIKPANQLLAVHLGTQTMQFFRGGELAGAFVVSTSLRPPANVKGSLGTPLGLHAIAEKIGHGQPPGHGLPVAGARRAGISASWARRKTGKTSSPPASCGCADSSPGVNHGGEVDSHDRYIYIHGTNHEERLGTPQSAGCVLMRNLELVELFEQVRVGDLVWIAE